MRVFWFEICTHNVMSYDVYFCCVLSDVCCTTTTPVCGTRLGKRRSGALEITARVTQMIYLEVYNYEKIPSGGPCEGWPPAAHAEVYGACGAAEAIRPVLR